jgi:hypothetical protein
MMAIPAAPINSAHPRNTDTRSQWQLSRRAFDHLPNDLVTRNELRPNRRKISFDNVKISSTNPASEDPKQNMPSCKLWPGYIRHVDELSRCYVCRGKNSSFQLPLSFRHHDGSLSIFIQ